MSNMIAKVEIEYRKPMQNVFPWLVERYVAEQDEYEFVSRHKTEEAANKRNNGGKYVVRKLRQHSAGYMVLVYFVDGSGYGYGNGDGNPLFPTLEVAEASALKDRARIGVVDRLMMGSSAYSCIVIRETCGDRFTVGIGIGSHTRHVKGSYATKEECEVLGKEEIKNEWNKGMALWEEKANKAGIILNVKCVPPPIRVLNPAKGVRAWDALTT